VKRKITKTSAFIAESLIEAIPELQTTARQMYPYSLDTLLGKLWISPCDGAIRTCFDVVPPIEPVGAPLNKYSGKWNFEGLEDNSDIGRSIHWIKRIMA